MTAAWEPATLEVPYQQSVAMEAALRAVNVPATLVRYQMAGLPCGRQTDGAELPPCYRSVADRKFIATTSLGRVGSSTATIRNSLVLGLTSYSDQKAPSR